MTIFLNYYGLDWLAMVLSLLALWLIGNKNRVGFVAFSLANVTWIIVGAWLMHSFGIVLGNAVFLAMNVRGYLNWKTPVADRHMRAMFTWPLKKESPEQVGHGLAVESIFATDPHIAAKAKASADA